ncbi:unnamed protein product [Mytilus edulis]|uniref:Peptidase A2 domain-containing protein n=1 Tax=Mytilus edulis TaxID=6550 RepID=A0A8S3UY28_MYTED|nr:unnamed protein product [Mytilus edulis]
MELPKLEKFNAFETENADVWIKRYELMCEFSKWDDVQATRAFTCFIDNYALAWYMLLDDEDRNSKDKLFPGQTLIMEQFILRGLRPEFVVPFVTATGLKQKFTISEAIDAALLADMTIQLKSKPKPDQVTSAIKDNPTPQNQPRSDGCSRADCKINVRIGSSVIHTLVDTGAAVSVINTNTYKSLQVDKPYPVDKSDLLGVRGVNDNFIRVLGKVTLPVEIGKLTLFHDFYILDDVNMPLILGRDFMHDQKTEISFPKQVLSLQNGMTEVSLSQGQDRDHTHNFVRVLSDVTFQPRQRVIFPVKIENFSKTHQE